MNRPSLVTLQILNWGGVALAIGLGIGVHWGFRVEYPAAWLFWMPGWILMAIGVALTFTKPRTRIIDTKPEEKP